MDKCHHEAAEDALRVMKDIGFVPDKDNVFMACVWRRLPDKHGDFAVFQQLQGKNVCRVGFDNDDSAYFYNIHQDEWAPVSWNDAYQHEVFRRKAATRGALTAALTCPLGAEPGLVRLVIRFLCPSDFLPVKVVS